MVGSRINRGCDMLMGVPGGMSHCLPVAGSVYGRLLSGEMRAERWETPDSDAERLVHNSGEIREMFQDHEVLDRVGTTGERLGQLVLDFFERGRMLDTTECGNSHRPSRAERGADHD